MDIIRIYDEICNKKVILSLFDYSGIWSEPYKSAGYLVIQIDLKLGIDIFDFKYKNIPRVYGVLAAPPCTHFSISGAKYWNKKDAAGQTSEDLKLVYKTLEIINYFMPKFWAIENPVGRLHKLCPDLGLPWYFHPYEYGDPWTKKTAVYGYFIKPKKSPVKSMGSWVSELGGVSERTKEIRSLTPPGFAQAFFEANK